MPTFTLELLLILLLILLNGVLAMSELAIVSSRKARLEQMANAGNRGARVALELANDPNQLLSTIQIGITLIGILTGTFGGATIAFVLADYLARVPPLAPYSIAISFGLVVSAITYLSLVIGELAPKRIALNEPERIAAAVAVPMRTLATVASPLVRLLSASNTLVLRLLGTRPAGEAPISEEEIKILLDQGTRAGVFQEAEQELVESVFRLGDQRVGALMTPRPDVVWLDAEAPPDEIRRIIVECTHARFPLARGSLDHVVGIVQAKTILARGLVGEPLDLAACAERPIFVPETMPAFRVLEVFKQSGWQMALVIDEYGGFQGLVTPSDVLDAIVGEIPSADELAEPPIIRREDGSWLVDGMVPIDDLTELLELEALPRAESGGYRTVGGFMMTQLGRVPSAGDRVEWGGLRFEVVDMDRNRVDKVLVMRAPAREHPEGVELR